MAQTFIMFPMEGMGKPGEVSLSRLELASLSNFIGLCAIGVVCTCLVPDSGAI